MIKIKKSFKVILPQETNEGEKIDYTPIFEAVSQKFGGYTLRACEGGWVDNNTLYNDTSKELEIATDDFNTDNKSTLKDVLNYVFNVGKQLAVFVTLQQGATVIEENDIKELMELI